MVGDPPTGDPVRVRLAAASLLVGVAAATHAPSLGAPLVYDDVSLRIGECARRPMVDPMAFGVNYERLRPVTNVFVRRRARLGDAQGAMDDFDEALRRDPSEPYTLKNSSPVPVEAGRPSWRGRRLPPRAGGVWGARAGASPP